MPLSIVQHVTHVPGLKCYLCIWTVPPIYLTDGYFNLALLSNENQQAPNGLYHFGFLVEDIDDVVEKIRKLNLSRPPKARPKGRPYAELRASDPDGNLFDISGHGYLDVKPLGAREVR